MYKISAEEIDGLLPQTQCGLCGYRGCLPYAQALANQTAPIHLCPPGGVETLTALAQLLEQDPQPFIADMQKQTKPPMLAVIREDECIGCTKCIQACPVDAIIGAAKQMHTILSAECTGCELCIPPCPVDCIDLVLHPTSTQITNQERAKKSRERYHAREERQRLSTKAKEEARTHHITTKPVAEDHAHKEKLNYVQSAVLRARAKKTI